MNSQRIDNQMLYHWRTILTFIVPSLIGVFLFMTPVQTGEAFTIPIALLAKEIQNVTSTYITHIVLAVISTTALLSLVTKAFKPQFIMKRDFLRHLLDVSPIWLITRLMGMVFVFLTFFKVGPEAVHSANTGTLVLHDLMPVLFSVFVLAGLLLIM